MGQKLPNAFGLYDLHGNVSEWCSDGIASNSVAPGPVTDPFVLQDRWSQRIFRGGSWFFPAENTRSAYRATYTPTTMTDQNGFRVVRTIH